jgi:hypothetical protein
VSDIFQNIDPPLQPASVSSPCTKGGGGGSIFWKTPAIGLASYNNFSTISTLDHVSKPPSKETTSFFSDNRGRVLIAQMQLCTIPFFNRSGFLGWTLGYNDFDFFDKMEPPRPEIDIKWEKIVSEKFHMGIIKRKIQQ